MLCLVHQEEPELIILVCCYSSFHEKTRRGKGVLHVTKRVPVHRFDCPTFTRVRRTSQMNHEPVPQVKPALFYARAVGISCTINGTLVDGTVSVMAFGTNKGLKYFVTK